MSKGQTAPAVTVRQLQREIMDDLQKLFANDRFKTPGGSMAAPKLYAQQLPISDTSEAPEEFCFPAIIVRLESGEIASPDTAHEVTLMLWAGIFEDSFENNGHFAVLEILERILRHYREYPLLGAASFSGKFEWALQDEQSYPYFYGGCYLSFDIPAPQSAWSEYT